MGYIDVHHHHHRDLLEAEEARIIAALSSVRTRLNQLAPISSLPPGVLEQIFDICVSWIYTFQKPKSKLAWTQVCRAWRSISFASGRLWQRIDLCDTRFADEFLVRSKESPLFVVSTSPLRLKTDNLIPHAGRLQSIDIILFPGDMAHLFSKIGPALSLLTDLSLRVPPASSALPLDISLTRVRKLALDGVTVPWDMCQDLTRLSLQGINPEACPSISQLHTMFLRSPHLEFVRLENLVPCNTDVITTDMSIQLPHLKEITVFSTPLVIAALFDGVYIPPTARLQLFCTLSGDIRSTFPHGLPNLKPHAQGDVRTVRLGRHGLSLLQNGTQPWTDGLSQTLFSLSSSSIIAPFICHSFDHLLNPSHITTLELNTGALIDISFDTLHSLLSNFHNLENLFIAFNDLNTLFKALTTPRAPTTAHLPCPALTWMSFSKPSDLWWHFTKSWWIPIVLFVKARRDHSVPLHTLEFLRCHRLSSETVEEVRNIVPVVIIEAPKAKGYSS